MTSSETMNHTRGGILRDTLCFFLGYHPYEALIFLGLMTIVMSYCTSCAMKFYFLYVKEKEKSKKFDVDVLRTNAGNTWNQRSNIIWSRVPDETEGPQDHTEAGPEGGWGAFNSVDSHNPEHQVSDEEQMIDRALFRHTNPLNHEVFNASAHVTHMEWLEWLKANQLYLWGSENFELICMVLLKLADEVIVLQPGNAPCLGDYMDMCCWRKNLDELIREMDDVVKSFPPEAYESGPCVLTKWRYGDFLRMLTQEILSHGMRKHGKVNKQAAMQREALSYYFAPKQ